MKLSVSGWNRCFVLVPDVRRAIATLLIPPILLASTASLATAGQLHFSGQVSNGSCAVTQATRSTPDVNIQRVKVAGGVSIFVDTSSNACAGQAIPFSAQYQAVAASPTPVGSHPTPVAGILVLTYQ